LKARYTLAHERIIPHVERNENSLFTFVFFECLSFILISLQIIKGFEWMRINYLVTYYIQYRSIRTLLL